MKFYESLGLAPEFALETKNFSQRCQPHQLCSGAYEKYDITLKEKKIGGNAQKRKRQVIFQHGSIPLSIDWDFMRKHLNSLPDDTANYVTTLSEELKIVPEKDILEQKLVEAFADIFNVKFLDYCHCEEGEARLLPPSLRGVRQISVADDEAISKTGSQQAAQSSKRDCFGTSCLAMTHLI